MGHREPKHKEPKETAKAKERALIFGAALPGGSAQYEEPLAELARLVDTAGGVVVGELVQRREAPSPRFFVGSGAADELKRRAEEAAADVIVSDNDLTPAQGRNIEKLTERRVVDRTELILDIFAAHARTRQAKLQVELAQLEYSLPRLKRMWAHLDRFTGGIGTRGPGETQLETDRRLIRERIGELKRTLKEIEAQRERTVAARRDEFSVSLVGYTNAGKSTLMNALSGASVLVEDKLFATLDTKTAVVPLSPGRRILLSDTVGFIDRVPHHLIASFHATLAEVTTADLLLHVVDASHEDPPAQVRAVERVLKVLGLASKETLVVLNKVDAVRDLPELHFLERQFPRHVSISALHGTGLDELRAAIEAILAAREVERELTLPAGAGRALAFLSEKAAVLERRYEGEKVKLRVRLEPRFLGQLRRRLHGCEGVEGLEGDGEAEGEKTSLAPSAP